MPYYKNYKVDIKVISQMPWYSLEKLCAFLKKLRISNILSEQERKHFIKEMNSLLMLDPICESHRRFPTDGVYVCGIKGTWQVNFCHLRAALELCEIAEPVGYASYVTKLICKIEEELAQAECVFDQAKFEYQYSLSWYD